MSIQCSCALTGKTTQSYQASASLTLNLYGNYIFPWSSSIRDRAEKLLPESEVGQLGRAGHEDVESGNISLLQWFGGGPYHYGIA